MATSAPAAYTLNMRSKSGIRLLDRGLGWLCVVPAGLMVVSPQLWEAAEPMVAFVRESGLWALRFFIVALLASPILRLAEFPAAQAVSRVLGRATIGYALVHLVLYFTLHSGNSLDAWTAELRRAPFVFAGLASLGCLFAAIPAAGRLRLRACGSRLRKSFFTAAGMLALFHFLWATDGGGISTATYTGALVLACGLRGLGVGDRSETPAATPLLTEASTR